MLQIQYASDLHIDDFPKGTPFGSFITPVAPVLVLAGDIGSAWNPLYAHFIAWCSRNWHLTILITGNHEYYDKTARRTVDETDAEINRLTHRFSNVVFLQNGSSYVIPRTHIRFVGATLWSAIDPAIWDEVAKSKGDFLHVYTNVSGWIRNNHPSDSAARHALHRTYLASALAPRFNDETLIVVTHYMPSWELLESHFRGEKYCTCYASHDDDLLIPGIKAWICGHSHKATRWQAPGGPMVLMNARGYNRTDELQRMSDIYSPHAVLEI